MIANKDMIVKYDSKNVNKMVTSPSKIGGRKDKSRRETPRNVK